MFARIAQTILTSYKQPIMKTKTLVASACCIAAILFFSFKSNSGDTSTKTVLITSNSTKGKFYLLYGDGKTEERDFKNKFKIADAESVIQNIQEMALLINEFKEKGYSYKGSHAVPLATIVLQKD